MAPQTKHSSEIENLEESKHIKTRETKEILYEGFYYDVTDWIPRHPGGKVIQFYTTKGEDATLAVQQFHNRSMKRILAIMKSFKRRPAEPEEMGLTSDKLKRNEALTKDFKDLHKELEDEGYFKPSVSHTIYRVTEIAVLNFVGLFCLSSSSYVLEKLLGMVLISIMATRCGWFMHEGGHHSITGYPQIDRVIHSFALGYGTGLSAVWWSSQHDVDLRTLPLIAFNSKVVTKESEEGKSFFIQNQSKLFILIDTFLVVLFWKLYLCPKHVINKKAYFDAIFMGLHYYVLLQYDFGLYIFAVWLSSVMLFVNFALSHTHLPVTDEPTHWVEYSLNHTTDIEPSFWCDWWMGYLNYQIEHHLFPTMPQFRQRAVSEKVKVLAKKHNIPYHCMSYMDALKKTLTNLDQVSRELKEIH